MQPDQYASTAVTIITLSALAIGTLAMIVRALVRHRSTLRQAGRQLVADMKKGDGFTFHRILNDPGEAPPPTQDQAAPQNRPLALRQWLDLVNNQPDRNPHLVTTGPSGSGKTTLTLAILQDRPGRVMIVTPKSKKADSWGGLPAIRLRREDMSFEPIAAAIDAVYQEMLRRNAEDTDVDEDWLTLVIDEFPTVADECKGLSAKVLRMIRLARSVRIRLILLATETTVKALGLEGNGDARNNCIVIETAEDRSATIYRWGKTPNPIDTRPVLQVASRPIPLMRWWAPQPASERPATPVQARRNRDYLSSLFADDLDVPVRAASHQVASDPERTSTAVHSGTSHQDAVPPDESVPPTEEGVPATLTPDAIRTLYSSGWSKNRIAAMLTGTKSKRIAIIDAALEKEPVT
jgi:energy-coupling factor transporter ATP-binding protein EcfA2